MSRRKWLIRVLLNAVSIGSLTAFAIVVCVWLSGGFTTRRAVQYLPRWMDRNSRWYYMPDGTQNATGDPGAQIAICHVANQFQSGPKWNADGTASSEMVGWLKK